jgi:hypothetical protein
MKAYFKFGLALACFLVGFQLNGRATGLPADTLNAPDTVSVGVYITSVHDVDFKEKQYAINLWLWLKYKNPAFDFQKNLEVPMAKTFEKSYSTIDTLEDGTIYLLMKLQCIMKGNWKIAHFPFDLQKLRFSIENSNFDASQLVFKADTTGEHYGKYFMPEWIKDSLTITSDIKHYETGFGDSSLEKPESDYGTFKVVLSVHRQSWELFLKLFLGMYISFLIAWICFYIDPNQTELRLSLSVGALFAVIGNKYIIDSTLPESLTFSLVDSLHGITLFYVFLVVAESVITARIWQNGDPEKAKRLNSRINIMLLSLYLLLNIWLVMHSYFTEILT